MSMENQPWISWSRRYFFSLVAIWLFVTLPSFISHSVFEYVWCHYFVLELVWLVEFCIEWLSSPSWFANNLPYVSILFQALEKKVQAGKWAEPHTEAIKTVSCLFISPLLCFVFWDFQYLYVGIWFLLPFGFLPDKVKWSFDVGGYFLLHDMLPPGGGGWGVSLFKSRFYL